MMVGSREPGAVRALLLEYEEGLTVEEAVADVRALYAHVAPAKVDEAAAVVERHADDLERLYFLLNCKYVPGFEAHYAAALAAEDDAAAPAGGQDGGEAATEEGPALVSEVSQETSPSPPAVPSTRGTRPPSPTPPVAPQHASPTDDPAAASATWCIVA